MTSARGSAEFAALVATQDRRLDREGIPMYLALVDETAAHVPAAPTAQVGAGGQLAARLDRFRDAMAAHQRDDDQGVYISVMQAVSYDDFDAARLAVVASASPTPEVAAPSEVATSTAAPDESIRPHGPRDSEPAL